jgi:hypothetical protein
MTGELYQRLIAARVWTEDTYQRWLADTITTQLFTKATVTR